jgi:poly(3-hydroxyalkanoate) depolymerase
MVASKSKPKQAASPAAQAEFSMAEVEGRTVRVARWCSPESKSLARPILFFNGIGANIELITPFAEAIASGSADSPGRDIITFDMPGIGKSPDPVWPYRPWMMARVANQIMDDFGYDDIDVMGVSWGGAMAQQYALQYGKRTKKLILIATSAGMLMVPGKLSALTKMADPRRYIDPDYMLKNFRTLYGGSTDGSGSHASRIMPPSMLGYMHQLVAMLGWTSAPFLPFMKPETLIMMGGEDHIVPVANGHILKSLIPNATLEVIEGGGHLFMVSKTAESLAIMRDFLDMPVDTRGAKAAA